MSKYHFTESDSAHQIANGQHKQDVSRRKPRGARRLRKDAQEDEIKKEEHSVSLQQSRTKVLPITHSETLDKRIQTQQNASTASLAVDSSSAAAASTVGRPSRAEDHSCSKNDARDRRRTNNIVINVGSRPRQTSAHSKRDHSI